METKYLLIKTDGYELECVGKFVLKDDAKKVMQEDWGLAIDNCPDGCFVIPGKTTLVQLRQEKQRLLAMEMTRN